MKVEAALPKCILCLALAGCGAENALPASAADTNSLRVVIVPSRTEVRAKESFKVALRVENPTATNQTVRVMNCSWDDHWKSSNTNVAWVGWDCTKNFAVNVEIPPGGAYTNELEMLIPEPVLASSLTFRMGFTPIGSPKTFWSGDVKLGILPPDTWRHGAAIYRDCNHDEKIDWEVSGETWRYDGIDTYKMDTNYDGFYDVETTEGGIRGGEHSRKAIHAPVTKVGKGFIPIAKPNWIKD